MWMSTIRLLTRYTFIHKLPIEWHFIISDKLPIINQRFMNLVGSGSRKIHIFRCATKRLRKNRLKSPDNENSQLNNELFGKKNFSVRLQHPILIPFHGIAVVKFQIFFFFSIYVMTGAT